MPEPHLSPAGLNPYDLVAPQKLLDPSKAHCLVCDKPAPIAPLRNLFRVGGSAGRDGHESCRAKTSEWGRQVDLLADDPEFVAASAAADEAWQAADALWHAKVDALDGPPDWFKRTRSSPMEGRFDILPSLKGGDSYLTLPDGPADCQVFHDQRQPG